MSLIGEVPEYFYSDDEIDGMNKMRLISVVEENHWIDLIGKEKTISDWERMRLEDIRNIVATKMNEFREEVEGSDKFEEN